MAVALNLDGWNGAVYSGLTSANLQIGTMVSSVVLVNPTLNHRTAMSVTMHLLMEVLVTHS
jgi:hypothetical protein